MSITPDTQLALLLMESVMNNAPSGPTVIGEWMLVYNKPFAHVKNGANKVRTIIVHRINTGDILIKNSLFYFVYNFRKISKNIR